MPTLQIYYFYFFDSSLMALGLKRGTVKLFPYNKKWRSLFKKEENSLRKKLGKLAIDIQHIGSTAVPGLYAKPIIDIVIGVKSLKEGKKCIKSLKLLGYIFLKKRSNKNQLFFVKGGEEKRTHYVHLIKHKGRRWRNDIAFRDYLRKYPLRAREYNFLKKKLQKRFAEDRKSYTKGKTKFIRETVHLANNK